MRVRVTSPLRHNGRRFGVGDEVDVDTDAAGRLMELGCVVSFGPPAPVAISSVAPPLAETEPPPAPDLGDDLAAVVESGPERRPSPIVARRELPAEMTIEPDPEPEAPSRRRRSR